MPKINVTPIETGNEANAELWNVRYATIVNLLNGRIDSDNMAPGAVTTPILATGSVTQSKHADGPVINRIETINHSFGSGTGERTIDLDFKPISFTAFMRRNNGNQNLLSNGSATVKDGSITQGSVAIGGNVTQERTNRAFYSQFGGSMRFDGEVIEFGEDSIKVQVHGQSHTNSDKWTLLILGYEG